MKNVLFIIFFIGIGFQGESQISSIKEAPYSRFLGNLAGASAEIHGTIYVSGATADSVWVSVFKESGPNTLQFVKATQTNATNGTYSIKDLEEGTYYLSAEPMTYSLKKGYAPTYYGDSAVWSLSKACYIQGVVSNKNINLTPIVSSTGTEMVSGSIKFAADVPGYKEGDPVVNASLFVFNVQNQLIAMTSSDAQGLYSFTDLPKEDIKVIVNSPGKKSSGLIINPSNLNNDVTFWVTGTRSYGLADPLFRIEQSQSSSVSVFPIPATNALNIQNGIDYNSVRLYNLSGSIKIDEILDENNSQIDISRLVKGVYILELVGNQTKYNQTILIE